MFESFAVAVAETFEFMQPFCSVAMRKQAAFESAPLKNTSSNHTLETQATDLTDSPRPAAAEGAAAAGAGVVGDGSFARVHYLHEPCDSSLTSSISEDEMLLPYDPSFHTQGPPPPFVGPVPEQVTFFTPRHRESHVVSRLSLQWHVRRSAGGFKGIDEWTGRLCEEADARQDTDGFLGQVTCYRVSPTLQMPTTAQEVDVLRSVHPHLAALAQYMTANTTLPATRRSSCSSILEPTEKPLFGLPLVLITDVQVTSDYRGMGLGLLLVDETCRCLANPAQWVLLAATPDQQGLRDYFGLLGFAASALLDGQVTVRWNDSYFMATHRYEDLCPHLPRVVIQ